MMYRVTARYNMYKGHGSLVPTFARILADLQTHFPGQSIVEDEDIWECPVRKEDYEVLKLKGVVHRLKNDSRVYVDVAMHLFYIEGDEDAIFEIYEKWKGLHVGMLASVEILERTQLLEVTAVAKDDMEKLLLDQMEKV